MTLPTAVILKGDDLKYMVEDYLEFDEFAYDVETVKTRESRDLPEDKGKALKDDPGLDAITNRVFWISFAGPGRSDVLPLRHTLPGPPQMHPDDAWPILEPLLFSDETKIGHNVKFDLCSVAKYYDFEIPPPPYIDTLTLTHVLDENFLKKGGFDLENLSEKILQYKYKEKLGKRVSKADFWKVARYSCVDAKNAYMLKRWLWPALEDKPELMAIFQLEMEVLEVLMAMYMTGVYVDRAGFEAGYVKFSQELAIREEKVFETAGTEFNLRSHPQRARFFYETLGMRCDFFTEKGAQSTNAEALRKLAKTNKVAKALVDYSAMQKLVSQYFKGFIPHIAPDERIRATYKNSGPVTGRYSCSRPNLQNIPARHQESFESKVVRELFIAPQDFDEEYTLLVADYSQIELRILAHQCKDPKLLMAYTENLDLHRLTASMIYGVPLDKVTSDQRATGKTGNFNFAFEGGPGRLIEATEKDGGHITVKEAKWVYESWHRAYPMVRQWGDYQKGLARERGYVTTLFGRRRRLLPDIRVLPTNEYNAKRRGYAERQAVNHPIQGSAGDIAKFATVRIHRALEKTPADLVMQVHDEFIIQTPISFLDEALPLVKEAMEGIRRNGKPVLRVPLIADINHGPTWASAK